MIRGSLLATSAFALGALPVGAQQAMPTTQPAIITITREIEKAGHFGAHEQTEIRWAALNRTIPNVPSTLSLVAASGVQEVWWITTYPGLDAWGKAQAYAEPSYTAALNKIAMEDGEHITTTIQTQAAAMPEMSRGTFPDIRTVRVYSIETVQLRPGQDGAFAELTKKWIALLDSKGVNSAWRTYSVLAGGPGGTLLIFESYPSWDALEAARKALNAALASAPPAEMAALGKGWGETVANSNVRYFTVNPRMSTVPKEMMSDPFWAGK